MLRRGYLVRSKGTDAGLDAAGTQGHNVQHGHKERNRFDGGYPTRQNQPHQALRSQTLHSRRLVPDIFHFRHNDFAPGTKSPQVVPDIFHFRLNDFAPGTKSPQVPQLLDVAVHMCPGYRYEPSTACIAVMEHRYAGHVGEAHT